MAEFFETLLKGGEGEGVLRNEGADDIRGGGRGLYAGSGDDGCEEDVVLRGDSAGIKEGDGDFFAF